MEVSTRDGNSKLHLQVQGVLPGMCVCAWINHAGGHSCVNDQKKLDALACRLFSTPFGEHVCFPLIGVVTQADRRKCLACSVLETKL
jgi:hypothetical protein